MVLPDLGNFVGMAIGILVLGCVVVWLLSKFLEPCARAIDSFFKELSDWWRRESDRNRDDDR